MPKANVKTVERSEKGFDMAQTIIEKIKETETEEVYEATCPHDSTIKPRRAKRKPNKEKTNEVSNHKHTDSAETSSEEVEG